MSMIERQKQRRLNRRRRMTRVLASHLADYLDQHNTIEGYTSGQIAKACYRLDEIEESPEVADEFSEALERCYIRAGYGAADGLPDWLRWAINVMANAIKFLVEHPALVKFLLSLLIGILDEKQATMPNDMGS